MRAFRDQKPWTSTIDHASVKGNIEDPSLESSLKDVICEYALDLEKLSSRVLKESTATPTLSAKATSSSFVEANHVLKKDQMDTSLTSEPPSKKLKDDSSVTCLSHFSSSKMQPPVSDQIMYEKIILERSIQETTTQIQNHLRIKGVLEHKYLENKEIFFMRQERVLLLEREYRAEEERSPQLCLPAENIRMLVLKQNLLESRELMAMQRQRCFIFEQRVALHHKYILEHQADLERQILRNQSLKQALERAFPPKEDVKEMLLAEALQNIAEGEYPTKEERFLALLQEQHRYNFEWHRRKLFKQRKSNEQPTIHQLDTVNAVKEQYFDGIPSVGESEIPKELSGHKSNEGNDDLEDGDSDGTVAKKKSIFHKYNDSKGAEKVGDPKIPPSKRKCMGDKCNDRNDEEAGDDNIATEATNKHKDKDNKNGEHKSIENGGGHYLPATLTTSMGERNSERKDEETDGDDVISVEVRKKTMDDGYTDRHDKEPIADDEYSVTIKQPTDVKNKESKAEKMGSDYSISVEKKESMDHKNEEKDDQNNGEGQVVADDDDDDDDASIII
ncbi:unnamed protein product [Pseudo-nitzschia multistriata]|uniref:Uncharacterized protein n=1 Tax=Pseudo-nitzschia multistriata TaxID=183589 RepID=A0A448ZNW5_9STRA|nr:unnamed protein product [Pseudo-nitzschia multistriata]